MASPSISLLDLGADILGILAEKLHYSSFWDSDTQNLCLVSRAFRVPCQRLLFRNISITNEYHYDTKPLPNLLELRAVLSRNPDLARYIRTLDIAQVYEGNFLGDIYYHWVKEDPVLPEVLDLFAASPITTLELTSIVETLHWSKLDKRLQTAFRAIFAKPTLRTLQLAQIIIPPLALTPIKFPHLVNLILTGSRVDFGAYPGKMRKSGDGSATPTVGHQHDGPGVLTNVHMNFYLEDYTEEFDDDIPIHEYFASLGSNFQTVRCLCIQFGPEIIPTFRLLLPSLRLLVDLRLIARDLRQDLSERLDLSSLMSLKNLSLCQQFQTPLDNTLRWTIDALTSIPSSHPSLLSLSVRLRFRFGEVSVEHQALLGLLSDELQRLCIYNRPTAAAADARTWTPSLRKVRLDIWPRDTVFGFGPTSIVEATKETVLALFKCRGGQDDVVEDTGSRGFVVNLELDVMGDDRRIFIGSALERIIFGPYGPGPR